jgi:hypothetical protein
MATPRTQLKVGITSLVALVILFAGIASAQEELTRALSQLLKREPGLSPR